MLELIVTAAYVAFWVAVSIFVLRASILILMFLGNAWHILTGPKRVKNDFKWEGKNFK